MINFLVIVWFLASVVWVIYKVKSKSQQSEHPPMVVDEDLAVPVANTTIDKPNTMLDEASDAERSAAAPRLAFEWVFQEITLPSEQAKSAMLNTWLRVANAGHDAGVRALENCWPEAASWQSGESYLHSFGWRPASDFGDDDEAADAYADTYGGPELMDLLYRRLQHVCQRIYRDQQVRSVIDPASPKRVQSYTGVVINRDGWTPKKDDPCGFGPNVRGSIAEGLAMLSTPAHQHPACTCTVDPYPV